MGNQEFPDKLVTTSGKAWRKQEYVHEASKTIHESKSKTDDEKSLDEL